MTILLCRWNGVPRLLRRHSPMAPSCRRQGVNTLGYLQLVSPLPQLPQSLSQMVLAVNIYWPEDQSLTASWCSLGFGCDKHIWSKQWNNRDSLFNSIKQQTGVSDNELVDSIGGYKLIVDISVIEFTFDVGCEELLVTVCGYWYCRFCQWRVEEFAFAVGRNQLADSVCQRVGTLCRQRRVGSWCLLLSSTTS